ncbi:MAG: hypothetical protein PUC68_03580 [Firmicutes bacterium]|nr:hypothetical protein [Bacillota bacterium]
MKDLEKVINLFSKNEVPFSLRKSKVYKAYKKCLKTSQPDFLMYQEDYPNLYHMLTCHFETGSPLQCGSINECLMTANIAKRFNFNMILQFGSNQHPGDAELIFQSEKYVLEFKEQSAKAGEFDLNIDEDGNLYPSDSLKANFPDLSTKVEGYNILDYIGKNIKIEGNYEKDVRRYMDINGIDFIVMPHRKKLFLIHNVENVFDFQGSEIRPVGRNPMEPVCLKYLQKIIGGEENISIPISHLTPKKKRGGFDVSRYSAGHIFFIRANDLSINEGIASFRRQDIKQSRPTISIHIKLKKDFIKQNI